MKDNPILPNRALFICDKNCVSSCKGCFMERDGITYTKDIMHAKAGPVVNVRDWETRFKIEDVKGELTYVEKAD